MESRTSKLLSLRFKAVHEAYEEERREKPSEAVLEACAILKRVIDREMNNGNIG